MHSLQAMFLNVEKYLMSPKLFPRMPEGGTWGVRQGMSGLQSVVKVDGMGCIDSLL